MVRLGTVCAATGLPRFVAAQAFQVALDGVRVAAGAYTLTVVLVHENDHVSNMDSCADWMVAPDKVPTAIGKLIRVWDHMLPELPTCI